MDVFDVHRHLGLLGKIEEMPLEKQMQQHIDVMDRLGVSKGLVMPSHAYPNPNGLADTQTINDQMAEARDSYPGKFPIALGTVEPMYGEQGLEEVDRMMNELQLDGVSWHNRWQRSYVDSQMMYSLIERAAEHDAVVLLHAYFESNLEEPWRVFNVINDFPDVDFIVADAFSGSKEGKKTTHWAAELDRDNVLFDTSGAKHIEKQLSSFVDEVGVENLVFGGGGYSDNERTSLPLPTEQIQQSSLSETEKRALLWDNAARVLGI